MPAALTSLLRRLGQAVRAFSLPQKVIALLGVAALVLGGIALTTWLTKPQYAPLFTGLSQQDASAIVDRLRSDNVPYELTDGGASILVPQDKVYDERLAAASAGLPSGATAGYSLLDKMGVTASEFQQDVTYKRALEGELASTIQAMKGVQVASVKLAIPKASVFTAEKQDPTASVFVETAAGAQLNSDQVQAIVHLVASSVESMQPTDVSVVDSDGHVLSAAGQGITGSGDEQAADYETKVQGSVQAMLDQIVGAGNATVVVAADMNTATSQRTSTTYTTPDGAPATSESSNTERYANGAGGSNGTAAGILGPDNIAVPDDVTGSTDGTATANGSGNNGYISQQVTKNNALNTTTEVTNTPTGGLTRQTVSVAINAAAAKNVNVDSISSLVAAAAGIDPSRGDQVAVKMVDFSTTSAGAAQQALQAQKDAEASDQLWSVIRTAVTALGLLIGIVLVFFLLGRLLRSQRREPVDIGRLDEVRAMLDSVEAEGQLPPGIAPAGALPSAPDPVADPEAERHRREVNALAGRDPAGTADLLRSLLDDRQPA